MPVTNNLLSSMWPVDLHFPAIGKTVAQVQINQTLIGDTGFIGHCGLVKSDTHQSSKRRTCANTSSAGMSLAVRLADDDARQRPELRCLNPQSDRGCCKENPVCGTYEYLAGTRLDNDQELRKRPPLPHRKPTGIVRRAQFGRTRSRPHAQGAQRARLR